MKNKFFIILLIFFYCSSMSYAAEYLVSNSSELVSAISKVKAGDVIVLKNGTWNNITINFQANGTQENPIILKAENAGQVFITGKSNLRIGGNYLVVDGLIFKNGYSSSGTAVVEFKSSSGTESKYSRLTNTSIIDYNPADTKTDYKWVSLYGERNRVDHCYFKGKTHIGTTLVVWLSAKPNYHLIDSNYFAYRPVFPENGAETIRVGTSDWSLYDSFTTVEYNYFEECNGETEIISSKSCGNIYRYNTFKNCEGTLTLRHGNRCTVEGNFFFCGKKPNSGGIRIIGEDHKVVNNYVEESIGTSLKSGITLMNGVPNSPLNRYYQVKRAVVAFNTVVNAKVPLIIGAGKDLELSLPPLDCVIANNIFYSNSSPLVTFSDQPINLTWMGNIFYGASIGMTLPSGNFNTDPKLSRGLDNIYRISAGSPALDAADPNFSIIGADFDGQNRTGIFDIGADELSSESIKIKPVGTHDTGPVYMRPVSVIEERYSSVPGEYQLFQNYPNPFNPSTVIRFHIPTAGYVVLKLYDVLGNEVKTLISEYKAAGTHNFELRTTSVSLESKNEQTGLPSGIYFYRISSGNYSQTKKMILLK